MRNQSIGWERVLIGAVLFNPDLFDEASMVLASDLTGCHQTIWEEIRSLAQRDALDVRAFIQEMRQCNELDNLSSFETEATGENYLTELISYHGESVTHYAEQVLAASGKRQLGMIAALIRT